MSQSRKSQESRVNESRFKTQDSRRRTKKKMKVEVPPDCIIVFKASMQDPEIALIVREAKLRVYETSMHATRDVHGIQSHD